MRGRAWLCDWVAVGYCVLVAALCAVRAPAIAGWWAYALAHLAVAGIVLLLVRFDRPGVVGFLRCWDTFFLMPGLFLMNAQLVHRVNPHDVDLQLAAVDRAIGGIALLRSMTSIEAPWLTDVSKWAWVSYYFLPLLLGLPLYPRGRAVWAEGKNAFVVGWLFTYVCYFALPARGPGYMQEELGVPQPKWERTATATQAKKLIDALEAPDPRHTFPSGHVVIAALVAWYLVRHRLRAWAIVGVPLSLWIIFATLYLRYHYVIDVIVGLAVAGACVWVARTQRRAEGADKNETAGTQRAQS